MKFNDLLYQWFSDQSWAKIQNNVEYLYYYMVISRTSSNNWITVSHDYIDIRFKRQHGPRSETHWKMIYLSQYDPKDPDCFNKIQRDIFECWHQKIAN